MALDPNAALGEAHQRLLRGETAGARSLLARVLAEYPEAASALHLRALIEAADGNAAATRAAFEAAVRAAPRDPQVRNNYANWLGDAGDLAAAVAHYRAAIAVAPDFAEAHANLGITLQDCGEHRAALAALNEAVRLAPDLPRSWQALGLARRELGDLAGAAAALDRAVMLGADARGLHARARVEAELGGPQALALYDAAARAAPADDTVALGAAIARHEAGDSQTAATQLAARVAAAPGWREGHLALAKLRAQIGDAATFTASFDAALAARPRDRDLWLALFGALAQAGQHDTVLTRLGAARAAAGADPAFDLAEAVAASETGDFATADALFTAAPGDRIWSIAQARHRLRRHDPAGAAALLEPLALGGLRDCLAWAYLETAWRLTGDPRQPWLIDVDAMTGTTILDVDLGALAATLHTLHRARDHPFDQTLRGGTQTDGRLFARGDPEIAALRATIGAGVARFIAALPPALPGHPLLGTATRDFRFDGSWSVRLRGGGLHINHVHPNGWLSSACYIALPDLTGDDGALVLGEPPVELGTDLPPLRIIHPQPGMLALFPAYLWHGTRAFARGERLTVAFDVVPAAKSPGR